MTHFRKLDRSSGGVFDSVLQRVKGQFDARTLAPGAALKLVEGFDELKKYKSLFVHRATEIKGSSGAFVIMLVEKHLTIVETPHPGRSYVPQKKDIEEVEPILIFSIQQDIGRALIKPEGLGDKIADLFLKVDIDLKEYPRFSRNYFAIAENPEMFRTHFPKGLLKVLEKVTNMTIEVNGHWGLLRTEKNLTEDLLSLLISIGREMTH